MFIHQYDNQNVRKTMEMVTELSAKYNDSNTNPSYWLKPVGRGHNTIQNSTVQYSVPKYNKVTMYC